MTENEREVVLQHETVMIKQVKDVDDHVRASPYLGPRYPTAKISLQTALCSERARHQQILEIMARHPCINIVGSSELTSGNAIKDSLSRQGGTHLAVVLF